MRDVNVPRVEVEWIWCWKDDWKRLSVSVWMKWRRFLKKESAQCVRSKAADDTFCCSYARNTVHCASASDNFQREVSVSSPPSPSPPSSPTRRNRTTYHVIRLKSQGPVAHFPRQLQQCYLKRIQSTSFRSTSFLSTASRYLGHRIFTSQSKSRVYIRRLDRLNSEIERHR